MTKLHILLLLIIIVVGCGLTSNTDNYNSEIKFILSKIDSLESKNNSLESEIDVLKIEINNLDNYASDLELRIDELEDKHYDDFGYGGGYGQKGYGNLLKKNSNEIENSENKKKED